MVESKARDGGHDGNLPDVLRVFWLACAPFSFLLAGETLWEKTVLTWRNGPQMVGFSLWHKHALFAVIGAVSSWGLLIWSLAALVFVAARRKRPSVAEVGMFLLVLFVVAVSALPDAFFAK